MQNSESRSYAARNLKQVVYLLETDDGVNPSQPKTRILGGLEFLKVSGSSKDRHVRAHPRSPAEFFKRTVIRELKAAGEDPSALGDEVLGEMVELVVADYQGTCTRRVGSKGEPLSYLPSLPDGTPDFDWFSIVVPKGLVEEGPTLSGPGAPTTKGTSILPSGLKAAIEALRAPSKEKAEADASAE